MKQKLLQMRTRAADWAIMWIGGAIVVIIIGLFGRLLREEEEE